MAGPDAGDRARATRIIERVRSYGVEVRVMPGHDTRGFEYPVVPTRVVDHHDASSRKSGEWGALGLILDGTPRGIPGPLSNAQVARCLDGVPRLAWVADGSAYHAGAGGPYAELPKNNANPRTYGVEKANDGVGEPYTAAANYATNALFHAMAVESGAADPGTFPIGHKEWAPGRKSDPVYSMNDRRAQVKSFRPISAARPPSSPTTVTITTPTTQIEDFDMAYIIKSSGKPTAVLVGGTFIGLAPGTDEEKNWTSAGARTVWVTGATWQAYADGNVIGMASRNPNLIAKLDEVISTLREQAQVVTPPSA